MGHREVSFGRSTSGKARGYVFVSSLVSYVDRIPMKIVSLLSAGTEIVCALGAGDALAGRSHECDYPTPVQRLPALTRPTFDVTVSSRDIDTAVRTRLAAGVPLYEVDIDLLQSLQPDVIITQSHCVVCAAGDHDLAAHCQVLKGKIVSLRAGSLEEIRRDVMRVGDAIGKTEAALDYLKRDAKRRAEIAQSVAGLPPPSVVVLEWVDPLFAMGNWGPEMVELAGGRCLLGSAGQHSAAIEPAPLLQADPDYIIIAPCGFDIHRTRREAAVLRSIPQWVTLRAVQTGKVFIADGNRYFNRSGTSITDSIEILAQILHGPPESPKPHVWQAWVP
jgi:iron complex transport system substrate-binding protein